MARNRKTSSRDTQPAVSSEDINLKDSSSDEDLLLKAFDAWTYVFLHSHVSMTDPILQLRIEHDDLEYQWGRFTRGQEGLDPNPKFRFLENHHILEYGLEENFIVRHDLAVMVRDLFMRDLDLTRCNRGLSSYIRMFRSQLDDSASVDVDDPGMYWKTLMQIVCLVMALCMRENQEMADYSPVDDLSKRWEQKTRANLDTVVNLERIADSAMAWMFEVATQAAQDTKRLYGLYQNTLKLLIVQLDVAIQELSLPTNEDGLVDNLMEIRNNQAASLHRNFERLGQPAFKDIDSDWLDRPGLGAVFDGANSGPEDRAESEQEWEDAWEHFSASPRNDVVEGSQQGEQGGREYQEEQERQEEDEGLQQEPTQEAEAVREEPKLEYATQDDTELSIHDNDGHEETPNMSGEVEKEGAGVEEKADGVEENEDGEEIAADTEEQAVKMITAVEVEDEEDEEEPLKRRYLLSKQAYDPYAVEPTVGGSSDGQPRGTAISFVRAGLDNLAQASLILSKSVQDKVANIRIQDLLRVDSSSIIAATAFSRADSQEPSTALQSLSAQEGETQAMPSPTLISSQTSPSESLVKVEAQPPSNDPSPAPTTVATDAPAAVSTARSLLAPERTGVLQKEPDPYINNKKTKRVFRAPSESEFEDDGDNIPVRELKRVKVSKGSVLTPPLSDNPQSPMPDFFQSTMDALQETARSMRQSGNGNSSRNGASAGSSNLTDWVQRNTGTTGQQPPPVTSVAEVLQKRSPPKEKRKYRPWSKEEVDRLMDLAPRFFHDQTPGDVERRKKRNVRWAQLKTYDEHHGNVLKHRTQVNLKDKYREKTDEGQHRQEVSMINRAKADVTPQHKFPHSNRGF